MHKSLFTGILVLVGFFGYAVAYGQSSTPSLCVKAFERITLAGVAPSVEIKVGGEEKPVTIIPPKTEYYIYLLAIKMPSIQLYRVWIKQELYAATINRVTSNPIVLENGKYSDTLFKFEDETVWQIKIREKVITGSKPKKDISGKVATNELVIQLKDKKSKVYTRTVKTIHVLKPFAGM